MTRLRSKALWRTVWALALVSPAFLGCSLVVDKGLDDPPDGPACGDGVLEGEEECDGTHLGGETCGSQGYAGGELACTATCELDLSRCVTPPNCGDGVIEGVEECDGDELGGATCQGEGLGGGTVTCLPNCTLDVSGCWECGDAVCEVDKGEGVNVCRDDCGWRHVSCGGTHACAVKMDGTVWCWGGNNNGKLGVGDTDGRLLPAPVVMDATMVGVEGVSAGSTHTCAWTAGGAAWCWGKNQFGQLGDGTNEDRLRPVKVPNFNGASMMSSANNSLWPYHTCALGAGSVHCWGGGASGQLGNGGNADSWTPVGVSGLSSATLVSTGAVFTCALESGAVWCWGDGGQGQLGDGYSAWNHNVSTPAEILEPGPFIQMDAGSAHACAVDSNKKVWCWGNNAQEQLGMTTADTNSATPLLVDGGNFTADTVSAGGKHTCALNFLEEVHCWGRNLDGECGTGEVAPISEPTSPPSRVVVLPPLVEGVQVSAGTNFSCLLTERQRILCWGKNNQGQLGDGTGTNSATPVPVIDPY